jgi:type II secretory pathway pseudopilin PulG
MKPFTKPELISLSLIFLLLVVISVPNFVLSLRRARDQVRRDDMGALQHGLDEYHADFRQFPLSSPDGKIIACKAPDTTPVVDAKGRLKVDLIPCEWGRDSLIDLTPGSSKVYVKVIPGDPGLDKGITYKYFSDGESFQIFAALEGKDEPEYDEKIIARNISCGTQICNLARSSGCSIYKTLEECAEEAKQK